MILRKYVEKIQVASNRKILQSLSGTCRDAYECALSAGATEYILRVLLWMRHHGDLTDEQFVASCENSVYVSSVRAAGLCGKNVFVSSCVPWSMLWRYRWKCIRRRLDVGAEEYPV